ncbi:MAG: exopolyphosphatase [Flavobacteriales bacterium]|nr:exopolyphosphatase [Flavobacteriales bacterium]MDG1781892.1 exopolyphosphatase [Flavobacteriales bacterium]MDG2246901.1 exopolyphosphatase [Flavobacteriales bacterium]
MKLAAIDIGSNAVRLLIEEIIETKDGVHTQKVSFTRIPLRLGEDVFEYGAISHQKAVQLVKVMKAFWYLMDVQDVEFFRACATSAMREAENGSEVVAMVQREANLTIELIPGNEEADLIFDAFFHQKMNPKQNYLSIDVGGGSTECTLIKKGQRVKAKSFKIGTVRTLKGKVKEEHWDEARAWVKGLAASEKNLMAIATGGNINRMFKMSGGGMKGTMPTTELERIVKYLKGKTLDERMYKLGLKADRADVIVPAGEIYLRILKKANIDEVLVPKIGLSDGIVLGLYNKWKTDHKK